MRKLLAVLLCVVAVPLATAQPPSPPAAPAALDPVVPQFAEIETVHSSARPGPALWHVTKGDSEVWILGIIAALPKDVTWSKQPLSDVMTGANAVIVPPKAKIDLLNISWFMLGHCCSFFRLNNGKLDDYLPNATKAKLAALRESVSGDAKLYQGDEPFGAAERLNRDFAKKYDLDGQNPMPVVLKLAGDKKVPQQPAFRFDPMPILREAVKLTPQQQLQCLEAAMEDVARAAAHGRAMAEAWAVGDIKGVKAHFAVSRLQDCQAATVHAIGEIEQNRIPAFVAAIDAALNTPGKTVAVVPLSPLLRKGGVLEQLEAQHVSIEGPAE
jgi:hypothetical protein